MEVALRHRWMRGAPLMAAVFLMALSALLLGGIPATGAVGAATDTDDSSQALEWEGTINGRPITEIDANDPLRLDPEEGARLALTLTNTSPEELSIRSVRLDGTVMGLTMYNFTTRIDLVMAPDSMTTRTFDLDLVDLSGQATGLIPSRLQLLDDDRNVLQQASFPADIRGSVNSVYGVFGLAVLGITLVLLGSLLLAIRRTQLPGNRWRRAIRFLPAGIGLGLVLTFTLSATRQLAPSATSWTTIVLLCAAAAFAVGYFLPIGVPDEDADPDVESVDQDGLDDTDPLESGEADGGDAVAAPATAQSAGHFWTSSPQGQGRMDSPGAEDDW